MNHQTEGTEAVTITLTPSKNENYNTLIVEHEGRKLYLHSKYDPLGQGEQWARDHVQNKQVNYIVFGGGLLYHVQALAEMMTPKSKILVVEPENGAGHIFKEEPVYAHLSQDDRIAFFTMEESNEIALLNALGKYSTYPLVPLAFRDYGQLFHDSYVFLLQGIKKHLLFSEIDINTSDHFAIEHMKNILSNVSYMAKGTFANAFHGKFNGKIAVVVSAGPSLDKNVDLLKGNEDKFIIISGGRTLQTLTERGIKPHFVLSADPSYRNFTLLEKVLEGQVPMINTLLSNKEIPKEYKGEKIFLNNSGFSNIDKMFFDKHVDTLAASGTVATLQLNFADYLGCSKVVFIGQDLAYTNNQLHAHSTSILSDEQGRNDLSQWSAKTIKIKGNEQEEVVTDDLFLAYLRAIEGFIGELEHATAYNCTEGGVYIQGAIHMKLNDFMQEYCQETNDFHREIDQIIKENKNDYPEDMIHEKMKEMKKTSQKIINATKDGVREVEKNIKLGKISKNYEKNIGKIDKIINKKTDEIDIVETLARGTLEDLKKIQINPELPISQQVDSLLKTKRALLFIVQGVYKAFIKMLEEAMDEIENNNKMSQVNISKKF